MSELREGMASLTIRGDVLAKKGLPEASHWARQWLIVPPTFFIVQLHISRPRRRPQIDLLDPFG